MAVTDYIIPIPETVSVAIADSEAHFPVRRVYCVGRNYAAHVREMGGDERDPPFFFQKPRDAIMPNGSVVPYPPLTEDFHYEIELVVAIAKGGKDISEADADDHVYGLAVGIDFTRRDLQVEARKIGRPWEIGKAVDHSAPITAICPLGIDGLPQSGQISLAVNGQTQQQGDLADMIWNCREVISILSTQYELVPGDLIYTGTPSGVGPVVPGDELVGCIDGLPELQITIGALTT